jgi:hypothetical protein
MRYWLGTVTTVKEAGKGPGLGRWRIYPTDSF